MKCLPFFSATRKDNLDSISDVWKPAFDFAVCHLFPSIKFHSHTWVKKDPPGINSLDFVPPSVPTPNLRIHSMSNHWSLSYQLRVLLCKSGPGLFWRRWKYLSWEAYWYRPSSSAVRVHSCCRVTGWLDALRGICEYTCWCFPYTMSQKHATISTSGIFSSHEHLTVWFVFRSLP